MKAIVLAAGRGERMEPLSSSRNKCLIEVHGKPLLEYSLDAATAVPEIEEIILVVGYQAESIINQYGIEYGGKRVSYQIQWERRGLVHALETASPNLDGHDFFLFLGDEVVLGGRYAEMIGIFQAERLQVLCGVVRVKDQDEIKKTYAVIQNDQGRVSRLIEKPERVVNDIMGTGNCLFRNDILTLIPKVPIHHVRGEKELPDLIQCAIDEGELVKSHLFCDHYINANTLEELERIEAAWPA